MDNLKNEEIIEMIKNGKIEVADIVDSGICPTCFDKENNHILYGNNVDKMIENMENEYGICPLVKLDDDMYLFFPSHYEGTPS